MTEQPGAPSALGIEAVECFVEGATVTVRVTGRWRRRRPEWRGQPILVVEAEGVRHRFPAMPEPPSLVGTLPGTWRMSFSVPAVLAEHLAGHTSLAFGAALIPLPISVPRAREEPSAGAFPAPDPETVAARQLRTAELRAEAARQRAAEADAHAGELERELERVEQQLEQARQEPDRLRREIAEQDRRRRAAEQREHAERSRRVELEEELLRRGEPAEGDSAEKIAVLEERLAELELELERAQRRIDEADQLAEAAQAARRQLEQRLEQRELPSLPEAERAALRKERIGRELALLEDLRPATEVVRPPRSMSAEDAATLALERRMLDLGRPGPGRGSSATGHRGASSKLIGTLGQLREELRKLRAGVDHERERREAAELGVEQLAAQLESQRARAARAAEGVGLLRRQLAELGAVLARREREGPAPPREAGGQSQIKTPQAAQLDAALERLRQATFPRDQEATGRELQPKTKPWLAPVMKALLAREPQLAGRLLLALLPAQGQVDPGPLSYDLVLGDDGCAQVTVDDGEAQVKLRHGPRPAATTQFQVHGDLQSIVRLLLAGPVKRRFSSRVARVRGDSSRLVALRELIFTPLSMLQLHLAGVRLDPPLAFAVAAEMVDRSWTAEDNFTIAYQSSEDEKPTVYLNVRDRHEPSLSSEPPFGAVETTIVCSPAVLLPVLAGERPLEAKVHGAERPLSLLVQWLERAQSG